MVVLRFYSKVEFSNAKKKGLFMKVINYLFIFSLCYANCFFSARAMDSSDSSEEDQDLQQKHFSSYADKVYY